MNLKLRKLPGKKSRKFLKKNKKTNLGWAGLYPFVQTTKGKGCYFQDLDGNTFLDFASQIASNPLGYNHPDMLKVLKSFKNTPIKVAGQDFLPKEHQDLIDELIKISPRGLNSAFLINSGAEAVENAMKTAFYNKPTAKFAISFESSFHGRTLGALSATNSKSVQKGHYPTIPFRRLPYNKKAGKRLRRILESEASPEDIAFVIMEPVQGEGGYRIPPRNMVREIRKITNKNKIFLISDEVQAGIGRTGKWWAMENFNIKPDIISSAKALQVGATIANKKLKPKPGAISSTWGGGHLLDLAMGLQTIKTIKKYNLLKKNIKHGKYLVKRLYELHDKHPQIRDPRGLGLMCAFDVPTQKQRDDLVIEMLKHGLVTVGCGHRTIRLIPPYIISEKEIDQAIQIIHKSISNCCIKGFKHKGRICDYVGCSNVIS